MAEINYVETDSAKIYTTVIESLMNAVNEPLYPGDERRIFGEGMVAVLVNMFTLFNDRARQRVLRYARGVVLDAIGERYDVVRIAPASAYATFRFTASTVRADNIIIPAGTRVTSDGSVYFATKEAAVLPAGTVFVDLMCVCTEGGAAYNGLPVGSIATLVDLIPYISGASNVTTSTGGDDGEPYTTEGDDRYRERIRLAPSKLSTAGPESGYRYWVLSADPDIIDVAIDCPEELPNTVNLYPLMRGGELPDADTLQKVLDAVNGKKTRPMTDHVYAIQPTAIAYSVEIKYYCTKDDEAVLVEAIEGAGGAIDQYNEWQTTALERDIDPDQLRSFIFAARDNSGVAGRIRMDVLQPTFTELSKWEFAKLVGTPIISHEVVTG